MRLWHQKLIPYLDRRRLLSQHREICALRGNGWGRKHSTVNYVFKYSPIHLYAYHVKVMNEMITRGYKVNNIWFDWQYRGKNCNKLNYDENSIIDIIVLNSKNEFIYSEHDQNYLDECLDNLKQKGINLNIKI